MASKKKSDEDLVPEEVDDTSDSLDSPDVSSSDVDGSAEPSDDDFEPEDFEAASDDFVDSEDEPADGSDEDAPLEEVEDGDDIIDGPLLLSKDEEFEDYDDDDEPEVEGLRDGEFVCSDCSMVFRLTALADEQAMLCRDCV